MMNNTSAVLVSNVEESTLKLSKAILIYEPAHRSDAQGYATVHGVQANDGRSRPQLLPGVPLTRAALTSALIGLSAKESFGFLPENVLAVSDDYIVWWCRPHNRNVWFNTDEPIGARCGNTPHPGLVFAATDHGWSVFAVKGDSRPTPETELFQAPYFNVWAGGKICTGNVQLPSHAGLKERMEGYEKAFFESYFTHPNVRTKGGLTKYRTGPYALWKALLDKKFKTFPEHTLVPTKMTAGKLVEQVAKGDKQ